MEMNLKKIIIYLVEWLTPSSTAVYILMHEYWGYSLLPSYFVACITGAIIFYPVNKYIFKN